MWHVCQLCLWLITWVIVNVCGSSGSSQQGEVEEEHHTLRYYEDPEWATSDRLGSLLLRY